MLWVPHQTREDGMARRLLSLGVLVLMVAGCENPRQKAIEKIGHDEEILKKVNAAVNEVIRSAPDCEVAKPLIPEAYQRIADARGQVTAPATQQTLDALKVQVDRIAQVCP
jgi:type II secretory pathway component PulM